MEKVFAFKVIEIGTDYVTLQTNGVAGGEFNTEKKKYFSKTFKLKLGESLEFNTNTMDSGSSFYVAVEQ